MPAAVLTRELVEGKLRQLEPRLRELGICRLQLFGSVARGEARAESDVDLLAHFVLGEKTFARFLAAHQLLEDVLDCRIELLTPQSMSPHLGPYILAEAVDVF